MKTFPWIILAVILTVPGTGTTMAETTTLYRWMDDNGNLVHSDRPPTGGQDYDVVRLNTQGSSTRAPGRAAGNDESQENSGKSTGAAQRTELRVEQKNPEYCAQARKNLQTLQSAARVRIKGEDGEFRFLTEEEKAEQRAQAKEIIDAHCDE